MRIHFQAVPWDLYVALAYAVIVTSLLVAIGVGNPLGLLLVIVVPGYLAMAALLPANEAVDGVLRIALSLGLSLALVAFVGLVLNVSPWGITFISEAISLLAASALLAAAAYWRRMALPAAERLELTINLRWARWSEYGRIEKLLAIALAIIVAVTLPLFVLSLTHPPPAQPYTELYLLGPSGNFTGIPSRLNISQAATVEVVVTNHVGISVDYTLAVDLLGIESRFNATSGANDIVVVNETSWSWFNFTLGDGGSWSRQYTFSIPSAGTWWVAFDLFRDGQLAVPYRGTHLLIDVP